MSEIKVLGEEGENYVMGILMICIPKKSTVWWLDQGG